MAEALRTHTQAPIEIERADTGLPYLTIELGHWSTVMVTPEEHRVDLFGVVFSSEEGYTRASKRLPYADAIAKVLHYLT